MQKTVLITGTSTGLGKTAAKHFVANGWNVVATMRSPSIETELVDSDNVLVTRLDVQDVASIDQAIVAGIRRFGKIDVLINNAGFGLFGLFESTPREKIREQFDVNLFGLMDVTRAILPHFRSNHEGIIINVGSGAGVFGLPMMSLYSGSKFALEGFSESLSYELRSQGIIVKIIEPGGVISTNFSKRSGSEAVVNQSIDDYKTFVGHVNSVFDVLRASRHATEEDVARVIFTAATDETDQLRYVATDDIKPWVNARRETSEAQYIAMMKSQLQMQSRVPTRKVETIARDLEAQGKRAMAFKSDQAEPTQADLLTRAVIHRFERLDILDNNA